MAFTQQEQEIINWGIKNGKTVPEMQAAVNRYRATGSPVDPNKPVVKAPSGFMAAVKDIPSDLAEGFRGAVESVSKGFATAEEARTQVESGDITPLAGTTKTIGGGLHAGAGVVGEGLVTLGKLFTSPGTEEKVLGGVTKVAKEVAESAPVKSLIDKYESSTPEQKAVIDGFLGTAEGLTTMFGLGQATKLVKEGVRDVLSQAGKATLRAGQFADILKQTTTAELPAVSGAVQTVTELGERVPRFFGRVKEGAEEATVRAEKIRTSPPAVGQALKVNLPEEYITFAQQIDEPTRKAVVRVLDIADEAPSVRKGQNPGIVGGELAGKQYGIIDKQRKTIGKQIGEAVDNLPDVNVNMGPSLGQLRAVLSENGIRVVDNILDISGSTISKAQALRLQELYDVAIRGGDVINAKLVHGFDRLFSQLQREARFEQLDNIFLKVNGEDVNAFKLFRDIFRNQLDNLSPEIRNLNKDYAKLTSIVDDIEDSIVKTPNFNITKSADPAEFAKVNLRRIFGEAQSSPVYEKIADEMDALARTLGYDDASPKDVAAFAEKIRKLYPETVPKAGFQGGIRAGLSDVIETVSRVGAPNLKDQQKALRALLESLEGLSETTKVKPNTQGGFMKIPDIRGLIEEAKKYKSAEEFVKAQGTPVYHGTSLENANKINTEGFKAGGGKGVSGQSSNDFVYATGNKVSANKYVSDRLGIKKPTVVEGGFNGKTLEINGKMADFEAFGEASKKLGVPLESGSQGKPTMLNMPAIKKAMQEQGYGAISFSDRYANGSKAYAILPENIKTKSQLTDIWNKANN